MTRESIRLQTRAALTWLLATSSLGGSLERSRNREGRGGRSAHENSPSGSWRPTFALSISACLSIKSRLIGSWKQRALEAVNRLIVLWIMHIPVPDQIFVKYLCGNPVIAHHMGAVIRFLGLLISGYHLPWFYIKQFFSLLISVKR